jgi:hypothetical protein
MQISRAQTKVLLQEVQLMQRFWLLNHARSFYMVVLNAAKRIVSVFKTALLLTTVRARVTTTTRRRRRRRRWRMSASASCGCRFLSTASAAVVASSSPLPLLWCRRWLLPAFFAAPLLLYCTVFPLSLSAQQKCTQ